MVIHKRGEFVRQLLVRGVHHEVRCEGRATGIELVGEPIEIVAQRVDRAGQVYRERADDAHAARCDDEVDARDPCHRCDDQRKGQP